MRSSVQPSKLGNSLEATDGDQASMDSKRQTMHCWKQCWSIIMIRDITVVPVSIVFIIEFVINFMIWLYVLHQNSDKSPMSWVKSFAISAWANFYLQHLGHGICLAWYCHTVHSRLFWIVDNFMPRMMWWDFLLSRLVSMQSVKGLVCGADTWQGARELWYHTFDYQTLLSGLRVVAPIFSQLWLHANWYRLYILKGWR